MAAAGKFAEMTSFEQLMAALNRLVADVESGKELRRFLGHTDEVYTVRFSNDAKFLTIASLFLLLVLAVFLITMRMFPMGSLSWFVFASGYWSAADAAVGMGGPRLAARFNVLW